jgi:hypothetical protein
MRLFNFTSKKRYPSQFDLGKSGNMIGSFFGTGYEVEEYNLYSQVKDYRTDLLNGTEWTAKDPNITNLLDYLQFFNMLSKYSTAIFNDFNKIGFAVFARIEDRIFYISANNYTKTDRKVTVKGFPEAETFTFDEPNFFCGEKTIFKKCEPFQKLYNVALSCQNNGMSKSGFVSVISPKTPTGSPTTTQLTDSEIELMERKMSESHGIATAAQNNMLILRREVDIKTIIYDFAKLGILETKKLCEEFVCSKLGVPYVLLPSSGQTFSNYEQANKILYENHSKYCEFFAKFAKRELGFDITYNTIAEAGKGIV